MRLLIHFQWSSSLSLMQSISLYYLFRLINIHVFVCLFTFLEIQCVRPHVLQLLQGKYPSFVCFYCKNHSIAGFIAKSWIFSPDFSMTFSCHGHHFPWLSRIFLKEQYMIVTVYFLILMTQNKEINIILKWLNIT